MLKIMVKVKSVKSDLEIILDMGPVHVVKYVRDGNVDSKLSRRFDSERIIIAYYCHALPQEIPFWIVLERCWNGKKHNKIDKNQVHEVHGCYKCYDQLPLKKIGPKRQVFKT